MKTGIELIADERQEQIEKHGRTIKKDVKNNYKMQLSFASSLLNAPDPMQFANPINNYGCPIGWDVEIWLKMLQKTYKERLVIAGALIAAEIDRIEYIEAENGKIP